MTALSLLVTIQSHPKFLINNRLSSLVALVRQHSSLPCLKGNVINLSIESRIVGGDAHIAPQGKLHFLHQTAANSEH